MKMQKKATAICLIYTPYTPVMTLPQKTRYYSKRQKKPYSTESITEAPVRVGAGHGSSVFIRVYSNSEAVEEHIGLFLQRSVYGNLLDIHPPFQIDGNFGFTAGVAEALLQSHEGYLRILPALPDQWKEGSIKGLKARGNITVDILWKEGKLQQCILTSPTNKKVKIIYDGYEKGVNLMQNIPASIVAFPK